jgi:hypothetical protein
MGPVRSLKTILCDPVLSERPIDVGNQAYRGRAVEKLCPRGCEPFHASEGVPVEMPEFDQGTTARLATRSRRSTQRGSRTGQAMLSA